MNVRNSELFEATSVISVHTYVVSVSDGQEVSFELLKLSEEDVSCCITAASDGDKKLVKKFLKDGVDVNARQVYVTYQ